MLLYSFAVSLIVSGSKQALLKIQCFEVIIISQPSCVTSWNVAYVWLRCIN